MKFFFFLNETNFQSQILAVTHAVVRLRDNKQLEEQALNPGALDAPDVQQLTFKSEACGAGAAHASRQVRGEEPITWRRVSGPNISLSACHNVRNGEEKKAEK